MKEAPFNNNDFNSKQPIHEMDDELAIENLLKQLEEEDFEDEDDDATVNLAKYDDELSDDFPLDQQVSLNKNYLDEAINLPEHAAMPTDSFQEFDNLLQATAGINDDEPSAEVNYLAAEDDFDADDYSSEDEDLSEDDYANDDDEFDEDDYSDEDDELNEDEFSDEDDFFAEDGDLDEDTSFTEDKPVHAANNATSSASEASFNNQSHARLDNLEDEFAKLLGTTQSLTSASSLTSRHSVTQAPLGESQLAQDSTPLISPSDVSLSVKCELGNIKLSLDELAKLHIGSVVEFAKWPTTVRLIVNNLNIAEGYLVEVNGLVAVKITNKISSN